MSAQSIQLKPIEGEVHLNCPECQSPRLSVTARSRSVPGGGYWLTDGDTIPDLASELFTRGIEQQPCNDDPRQGRLSNYDYELCVGDCPHCAAEYYVINAKLIDDAVVIDAEFAHRYFFENAEVAKPTNWVASLAGKNLQWVVERHETPIGVAVFHTFGPYSLHGASLKGVHGVAGGGGGPEGLQHWARAREFLISVWPQLKALAVEVNLPSGCSLSAVHSSWRLHHSAESHVFDLFQSDRRVQDEQLERGDHGVTVCDSATQITAVDPNAWIALGQDGKFLYTAELIEAEQGIPEWDLDPEVLEYQSVEVEGLIMYSLPPGGRLPSYLSNDQKATILGLREQIGLGAGADAQRLSSLFEELTNSGLLLAGEEARLCAFISRLVLSLQRRVGE